MIRPALLGMPCPAQCSRSGPGRVKEETMATASVDSREELVARVQSLKWAHQIDLGDGIVTPGEWGTHSPSLWQAIGEIDFGGKTVLDVGCWDGLWSFEAERRGAATVYATDLMSQQSFRLPTFALAHEALKSRVHYEPNLSVYDVERLGIRDFDVVIFAGVYYHLKDPLRALATLRRVMKEGGQILVEGAVIDAEPPWPGLRAQLGRLCRRKRPAQAENSYARFYYHNTYAADDSNWWVPTVPCLLQWVECNFFDVQKQYALWKAGQEKQPDIRWDPNIPNMRCTLVARAVCRPDPRYCRPDAALAAFDRNTY
jgi:tRNA (mo5U34)-methyltransferase